MTDSAGGESTQSPRLPIMHVLHDKRTECFSVMTEMSVASYLELVSRAHATQGGIEGQRAVLGTTTARRIRERMISDLEQGAVLPPVVIGVVLSKEQFAAMPPTGANDLIELIRGASSEDVSIIDGMQRTAALEAACEAHAIVRGRPIRIEVWITDNVRALIYRMLVLNTGQVPWTLDRQISVVFASMLKELRTRVPSLEKIITPDDPGRRVGPGQLRFDAIVEMYMTFSLRKIAFDTREKVSDEFSRLDFVENLDDQNFQDQFYDVLTMLVALDNAFSRAFDSTSTTLDSGRKVFDRQPARIGYMTAVGLRVLGRPGETRTAEKKAERLEALKADHDDFVKRLNSMSEDELVEFMKLDVLSEVLDRRVGQVGRFERNLFLEAFKVLIEDDFTVESMAICWLAG